jgi:hypothetical protein
VNADIGDRGSAFLDWVNLSPNASVRVQPLSQFAETGRDIGLLSGAALAIANAHRLPGRSVLRHQPEPHRTTPPGCPITCIPEPRASRVPDRRDRDDRDHGTQQPRAPPSGTSVTRFRGIVVGILGQSRRRRYLSSALRHGE